jgi:hypothetical protein
MRHPDFLAFLHSCITQRFIKLEGLSPDDVVYRRPSHGHMVFLEVFPAQGRLCPHSFAYRNFNLRRAIDGLPENQVSRLTFRRR